MGKLESFQDLLVWQKAHQLTLRIYQITKGFPGDEKFGLITQIRRSCASVPANIVEGFKRMSRKDQSHFLNMAQSSLEETKYQILLSRDLNYIDLKTSKEMLDQADEVGRMLFGFRRSMAPKVIS
jgi:four helix bundle protein